MKSPIVKILVTVPDVRFFDACTLCFDTLRVGWPTAEIHVDMNYLGSFGSAARVAEKAEKAGCKVHQLVEEVHHATWISDCVRNHNQDRPLVILDADTIFWKSCEDWEINPDCLLGGYYVPFIWNDFAKCPSFPRIHTSLMVFPDVARLRSLIYDAYPPAQNSTGAYSPCDPFMPAIKFIFGKPYFWDSCANLFSMLQSRDVSTTIGALGDIHLECFDHINSASFYETMVNALDNPGMFKLVHNEWVKTPEKLRNLWPSVGAYYEQKRQQALTYRDALQLQSL